MGNALTKVLVRSGAQVVDAEIRAAAGAAPFGATVPVDVGSSAKVA